MLPSRARSISLWLLITLIPSLAGAGRPTQAQALAAANAWLEALAEDQAASLAERTAETFFAVVRVEGEEPRCGPATASTRVARSALLACLAESDLGTGSLAAWKKGARRRLAGPLAGMDSARIAALERTATLVVRHTPCVGQGGDVIIAVAREKGAKAPVVTAVLAQSYYCGE